MCGCGRGENKGRFNLSPSDRQSQLGIFTLVMAHDAFDVDVP